MSTMHELARQILEIAERPTEVGTGEWEAARSALVGLGVDLARAVLGETVAP